MEKLSTDHGGVAEHPPPVLVQAIDPRRDHAADGRRHPGLGQRTPQRPAAVAPDEGVRLEPNDAAQG